MVDTLIRDKIKLAYTNEYKYHELIL